MASHSFYLQFFCRSLDDVRMNLEVLKYCATVLFLVCLHSFIFPYLVNFISWAVPITLICVSLPEAFLVPPPPLLVSHVAIWNSSVPQWLNGQVKFCYWEIGPMCQ